VQTLVQVALVIFGVGAVYLSQSQDPNKRRWACIVGLCGQPFWYAAAWGQPGMLVVVTLYTYCWMQGIWNNWRTPMFERIKSFFRNLFSRFQSKKEEPSVSTIAPVSGPTQTELRILQAIAFLKTRVSVVSVEDVMMRLGFGLTPEEVAFAVRNGAVERQSAPVVAGVDRESFNLTAENGFLVHPKTESGKTYGFTFPKSTGLLRVLSYSGSQITKVNGEAVIGGKDFEVSSGSILLTVEFVGDRYAVQFQPR
jgi:hypothetical protein